MALSSWLSQDETTGTFKWSGSVEDLKDFVKEVFNVNKDRWSRSDGPNGDPFNCKIGDDMNIRWFPSTHTLQIRGKQADCVKQKLIQTIDAEPENAETSDEFQNSRHFVETMEATDAPIQHCCCVKMFNELADIRNEIAAIRAERQEVRQDTGLKAEIERLKAELVVKESTIRNLEDERNSYQVALKILTKECTTSDLNAQNNALNNANEVENNDPPFQVVTNKRTKKKNPDSDVRPTRNRQNNTRIQSAQESRHVMIIGDSIIKNVEGWRLGRSTKTRTTIKSFPGATVDDCYHYFKPPLGQEPDQVIIHVGTNDLNNNSARGTAESIVDLASWAASEHPASKIAISEITIRMDKEDLGCKIKEANKILRKFCRQNDWQIICHDNIDESCLNRGKLHPNKKGTGLLASNFIKCIRGQ